MALRRWTPFLSAFAQIDATIEAAGGGCISHEVFRRERDRVVEALRGADADDDGAAAEEICSLLDAAMVESLVTLRDAVPAAAVKGALASGEVVVAIGKLMKGHASPRVRWLARDVVRGWRAGVKEEVAMARAAMNVLDGVGASAQPLPPPVDSAPIVSAGYREGRHDLDTKKQAQIIPEKKQADLKKPAIIGNCDVKKQSEIVSEKKKQACPQKPTAAPIVGSCDAKKMAKVISEPKKSDPIFGCVRVKASAYTEASTEIPSPPPPKKTLPTTTGGAGVKEMMMIPPSRVEETKMEATKRKLHERYQEAENAKRRRTVRVIEAPPLKTKSQMQGRTTQSAVMRARGRASSAGERRFFVSSLRRV